MQRPHATSWQGRPANSAARADGTIMQRRRNKPSSLNRDISVLSCNRNSVTMVVLPSTRVQVTTVLASNLFPLNAQQIPDVTQMLPNIVRLIALVLSHHKSALLQGWALPFSAAVAVYGFLKLGQKQLLQLPCWCWCWCWCWC